MDEPWRLLAERIDEERERAYADWRFPGTNDHLTIDVCGGRLTIVWDQAHVPQRRIWRDYPSFAASLDAFAGVIQDPGASLLEMKL